MLHLFKTSQVRKISNFHFRCITCAVGFLANTKHQNVANYKGNKLTSTNLKHYNIKNVTYRIKMTVKANSRLCLKYFYSSIDKQNIYQIQTFKINLVINI